MAEQWRSIPGFESYAVSDLGRVRRAAVNPHGSSGYAIAQFLSPNGYQVVSLFDGTTARVRKVHRLMLIAFLGPPPAPGAHARHLNGDRLDNRLDNLAWGSAKENAEDRTTHGRTKRGEEAGRAVLTAQQVLEIRQRYCSARASSPPRGTLVALRAELACRHRVSEGTVKQIVAGTIWKHLA